MILIVYENISIIFIDFYDEYKYHIIKTISTRVRAKKTLRPSGAAAAFSPAFGGRILELGTGED